MRKSKLFGLVGYPLGYSFSQPYFTEKFAEMGLAKTHRYVEFVLPAIEAFPDIFEQHDDVAGLNVTIPYKQAVLAYLDELSPAAAEIGAVNTILVKDGKKVGYNTDVLGFRADLLDFLLPELSVSEREDFLRLQSSSVFTKQQADNQVNEEGSIVRKPAGSKNLATAQDFATLKSKTKKNLPQKALVLGTGGASLAVHYALREIGIAATAVSRTPGPNCITYADITPRILAENRLIVNTTPLGTYPKVDGKPNLPYVACTDQHYCYDLVYNPAITSFLRTAAEYGAQTRNGLGMLHGQAEAAWEIWTGQTQ